MMAAAILQRDAGSMLSNLQILSQFAMSSEMMGLGIGQMFPHDEVAGLSLAPQATRTAK